MASSGVHYRTLSVHGLEDDTPSPIPASSASFLTRRSSFSSPDVKPFSINSHRKYSDAPSLPFSETPSKRQRTLPRNSKCLRTTAYLGWTLAGLLFVVLVVNQSSISPSEHIQNGLARVREHPFASKLLDNVGLNKVGTGAVRVSHASKPGRTPSATGSKKMSGGVKSPVTIVSSFYRIDTGKKHRISGRFTRLHYLRELPTDVMGRDTCRIPRMVDKLPWFRRTSHHFLLRSLDGCLHSKLTRQQGEITRIQLRL